MDIPKVQSSLIVQGKIQLNTGGNIQFIPGDEDKYQFGQSATPLVAVDRSFAEVFRDMMNQPTKTSVA